MCLNGAPRLGMVSSGELGGVDWTAYREAEIALSRSIKSLVLLYHAIIPRPKEFRILDWLSKSGEAASEAPLTAS